MMISYSTAAPEAAGPVADPFEIHNLAFDPKRVEKMSEMREVLDAWIEMCDDPLDMPEDELVRTRVYPPEGEQRTTAPPRANRTRPKTTPRGRFTTVRRISTRPDRSR